ncbi:HTH-type transcriptional regulator BenM [Lacunisphaera limnophila]|uniref:HTH-type transcriptional regulator BenM n=1 Tax=Lacunisphaera limnophila TaxID=1838286 RepID=A0A1D8AU07_9BACT|nr:LysR substrate-binding domain-containing protein [Lacunisphaera limnophila]AOS44374.1 HTH-type transcriptional regulator BenM [Lacunisphaera limnophila]
MIDYSIRELECFVAVAEELSFTRAARRLHLSQPPLSRHIQSLEARLGIKLFTRSPRSVALTPAGRALLTDTKGALVQLQRAGDRARRASRGETARLDLGFVSAVLNPDLISIFQRYRTSHPAVDLTLHDCPPAEQLRAIAEGRLDGGFVGASPATLTSGLVFIPWSKEPLMVFLPRGHRLQDTAKVRMADLAAESFVMVAAESAPCFSQQIHELCLEAGFRPKVVQEASRGQAVAVMVAAGTGIAILPASMSRIAGESSLAIPITTKGATVTYVFAHRRGEQEPPLRNFVAGLEG